MAGGDTCTSVRNEVGPPGRRTDVPVNSQAQPNQLMGRGCGCGALLAARDAPALLTGRRPLHKFGRRSRARPTRLTPGHKAAGQCGTRIDGLACGVARRRSDGRRGRWGIRTSHAGSIVCEARGVSVTVRRGSCHARPDIAPPGGRAGRGGDSETRRPSDKRERISRPAKT